MKYIEELLKWWNKPTYWEKVDAIMEEREKIPCTEISFSYANGVTNKLVGPEAHDYYMLMNYAHYGSSYHRRILRETKWNWIQTEKEVDEQH